MESKFILLHGKLPKVKPDDAKRLAVYIARGNQVLAQSQIQDDGSFRVRLSRQAMTARSIYPIDAVFGPGTMSKHLEHVPGLQRVRLSKGHLEKAENEFAVPVNDVVFNEEILKIWWRWCEWYCVSGTVVGPDGCSAPGAEVTVYTVGFDLFGFTKTPRTTVTTDANGHFTACFLWCSCPFCCCCWPCWPIWWECWPWWWELDILHVIEALEQMPPVGPGPVEGVQRSLTLLRPKAEDLVRGQGFAAARARQAKFAPDPARKELIRRKFSNEQVRRLFPGWWWCCDDPNVVFSVAQGSNTILDEDPSISTRWCLEENSTVVLVGNQQTVTACPGDPPPESGFAWTRVGNITVDHIHSGYADGWGGDSVDLAFAGALDIYGGFAPDSGVSYYQVDAGQWSGNPARGGTAPASASPLSANLYNYIFVFDNHGHLVFSGPVKMGPFSQTGLTNLYSTQEARPTAPTGTGLDPFPAIPAGGFFLWAYEGLKVSTSSSALIGGGSVGAVDLTIIGYDSGFSPVTLTPDDALTLEIDNTGITTAHINSITARKSDGSLAPLSGTSDCPGYDVGPGGYVELNITVTDTNGHLWEYEVDAEHGHGQTDSVPPGTRGYSQPAGSFPLAPYQAPDTIHKSFVGGTEVPGPAERPVGAMVYYPPADCCYEFRIRAGKRVTNGYTGPSLADYDFQTVSLIVSA